MSSNKTAKKRSIMTTSTRQTATTDRVQIEASVVLKIVKHASNTFPSAASGPLLGFDSEDGNLDVTYSFPFPQANESHEPSPRNKSNIRYQNEMIEELKEINIDSTSLGWYQTSTVGSFYKSSVVEALLQYQLINPNTIVLIYDVNKSVESGLSLRAYRLSEEFLSVHKTSKFTTENLIEYNLTYENIFNELPVEIHNAHLINLLMFDLDKPKKNELIIETDSLTPNFDSLNLPIDTYINKNIENILDSIDDFNYDQGNYHYYQRQLAREQTKISQWKLKRKQINSVRESEGQSLLSLDEWKTLFKLPAEPSRLENLLLSGQIDTTCGEIQKFGASTLSKLFASQKTLE